MKFSRRTTGLHINEKLPYLGASPDGLTECECCTEKLGLVEIKCPKVCENKTLTSYFERKNGPIKNGKINEKHDYFQMQLQMLVTERSFCDFFVWSIGLFGNLINKLEKVFLQVIFPELVTRNNNQRRKTWKQKLKK